MKKYSLLWHIREGIRNGYPLCCNLRWSIQEVATREPHPDGGFINAIPQARQRGSIKCPAPGYQFVPCNVFHKASNGA